MKWRLFYDAPRESVKPYVQVNEWTVSDTIEAVGSVVAPEFTTALDIGVPLSATRHL